MFLELKCAILVVFGRFSCGFSFENFGSPFGWAPLPPLPVDPPTTSRGGGHLIKPLEKRHCSYLSSIGTKLNVDIVPRFCCLALPVHG